MKNIVLSLVAICVVVIVSCSEFIEPSLEDKKVFLNSPSDSIESNKYNQQFWWDPVEGTATFRFQIASPSFDSIAELVVDTLIANNKFSFVLDPGKYQWRVRAENSASSGIYSSRKLIIHHSSIAAQKVQLKLPATGFTTNQRDVTYSWHSLFGATVYRLQIDTNNFSDENIIVFNSTTPNVEQTVSLTADKNYQWRVRAEADTTVSKWSQINSFTLDATPPAKVILSFPAANQVVSKPVNLQWNAATGASKYQVMIYKSDGTTPFNSSFPVTVSQTSYSFNDGDFNETLQWKVRAVDAVGNSGAYSDARSFTIQ